MTPSRTGGFQSTSCIVPAGKMMNTSLTQLLEYADVQE